LEPATITTVLGSRVKAAGTNAGPLVDEKQLVLVFFAWRGFPGAGKIRAGEETWLGKNICVRELNTSAADP
jgi:hypothetical protein